MFKCTKNTLFIFLFLISIIPVKQVYSQNLFSFLPKCAAYIDDLAKWIKGGSPKVESCVVETSVQATTLLRKLSSNTLKTKVLAALGQSARMDEATVLIIEADGVSRLSITIDSGFGMLGHTPSKVKDIGTRWAEKLGLDDILSRTHNSYTNSTGGFYVERLYISGTITETTANLILLF